MSRETLRAPFFHDLWPLILNWNRCATEYSWTKRTTKEFYKPQRNFDHFAAHEYLAKHGYDDYSMPETVICFQNKLDTKSSRDKDNLSTTFSSTSSLSSSQSNASSTFAIFPEINLCKHKWFGKRVPRPIRNMSRVRISCINYLRKQRSLVKTKHLSVCGKMNESDNTNEEVAYINPEEEEEGEEEEESRKVQDQSWIYAGDWLWEEGEWRETPSIVLESVEKNICKPSVVTSAAFPQSELCPTITFYPKTRNKFSTLVKSVLEAFVEFNCKFLIIYIGDKMEIMEMERWLSFMNKALVLVITTCPNIAHKVRLLGRYFFACVIDKDSLPSELSYQAELENALKTGLKFAREEELLKYCGNIFIFAFAEYRDQCNCNLFCIMKRI